MSLARWELQNISAKSFLQEVGTRLRYRRLSRVWPFIGIDCPTTSWSLAVRVARTNQPLMKFTMKFEDVCHTNGHQRDIENRCLHLGFIRTGLAFDVPEDIFGRTAGAN